VLSLHQVDEKTLPLNNQLLSQTRKNTKIATLENNVRDKKKKA